MTLHRHLISFAHMGGGPRYVCEVACAAARDGDAVEVFLPATRAQRHLVLRMKEADVRVVATARTAPDAPTRDFIRDAHGETSWIHIGDPWEVRGFVPALRHSDVGLVLHALPPRAPRLRRVPTALVRSAVLRAAARVTFVSAVCRDAWAAYAPRLARATIVPGAVAACVPAPRAHPVNRAPRLLHIGSVYHAVKGQLDVVDALRHVDKAVTFAYAGRGPDEDHIRQHASDAGVADRVRALGLVDDVAALLDRSDLFVFPSRTEAFPLAPLEAMARGVPTLLADIPALRAGFQTGAAFFPVGDSRALAAQIQRLLNDNDAYATLSRRGLALAQRHSWNRTVHAFRQAVSTRAPC